MHLRARSAQRRRDPRASICTVAFAAGETIHTEISRKFTRDEVETALRAAGFELVRWYTPPNNYFALALSRAA